MCGCSDLCIPWCECMCHVKQDSVPETPYDEPITFPSLSEDVVNHPTHYNSHPSGVECIQVTEWMSFNLGNAIKYIWRADEKGKQLEDLRKAIWYIEREIDRLDISVD